MGFAILALFSFTLPFFFAIRIKTIIRTFGGLAAFYRIHHLLGVICLFSILAHIVSQFQDIEASLWFLLLDVFDIGLMAGWIGFGIFLLSFFSSYLKTIQFKNWKKIHLLFIPSFLLIVIHVILFLPESFSLSILVWILLTFGVVQIGFRLFQALFPIGRKDFLVEEVNNLGNGVFSLVLKSKSKPNEFSYRAGEIVYIRFEDQSFSKNWHPFSVASCEQNEQLKLYIKGFGKDTLQMNLILQGSALSILGPYNEFQIKPHSDQVWVAGGIGIAPFLGMIQCLKISQPAQVLLIYFVNSMEEVIGEADLKEASSLLPNFHWIPMVLPKGYKLEQSVEFLRIDFNPNSEYLVCGSSSFMKEIRLYLRRQKIGRRHIHTEEFTE